VRNTQKEEGDREEAMFALCRVIGARALCSKQIHDDRFERG